MCVWFPHRFCGSHRLQTDQYRAEHYIVWPSRFYPLHPVQPRLQHVWELIEKNPSELVCYFNQAFNQQEEGKRCVISSKKTQNCWVIRFINQSWCQAYQEKKQKMLEDILVLKCIGPPTRRRNNLKRVGKGVPRKVETKKERMNERKIRINSRWQRPY